MRPFTHNTLIGTFFDVLSAPGGSDTGEISARKGATARQDAILSVISGKVGLEQLPEFAASLRELLTGSVRVIVLDLSCVTVFSPNAVSVLVNFMSFVEGGGKRLVLFRPARTVQTALETLRLTHLFEIQHSENELLLDIPD